MIKIDIEMPDSCFKCDLSGFDTDDVYRCCVSKSEISEEIYDNKKD